MIQSNANLIAPVLTFLPKGLIGTHITKSENSWELRNNNIHILNSSGIASIIFNNFQYDEKGISKITGAAANDTQSIFTLERITLPTWKILEKPENKRHPEFILTPKEKFTRRKNLIILRANSESIHTSWPKDISDSERNWDLCISWYGPTIPDQIPACEYLSLQPEDRKFSAIHSILFEGSPLWDYERIWLPDDDIMISWGKINRLFAIFHRHDLDLAQPSLSTKGYASHAVTIHNPSFFMRYTNFVEVMCPLFSKQALKSCHPIMSSAVSGWGLDYIWPYQIGLVTGKIAIIDDIQVIHTRPVGNSYDVQKASEEDTFLRKIYGVPAEIRNYGGILQEATK